MKSYGFFSLCLAAVICFSACQANTLKVIPEAVYQFDLQQIAKEGTVNYEWAKSSDFEGKALLFSVSEGNNELVLTTNSEGIDWTKANYLVCEVWHDNQFTTMLNWQFYRKTDGSAVAGQSAETGKRESAYINGTISILPSLKTKMVLPLSHLNAQQVFLSRPPRQLKGTVWGRRLEQNEIGKVTLRILPYLAPDLLPKIQIAAIYLTEERPQPYEKLAVALVDSFGQWTARDWPGKVHNSAELMATMLKNEAIAASASFPDEWSAYGGWKQLRFTPKGFFYTHHDGKRWWLVDPEGYAFISAGVTCMTVGNTNAAGVVSGQEELFSWLPEENDNLFGQVYYSQRNNMKMIDFLKSNLIRVYGAGWKEKWEATTAGLMKYWRLNTVANWSDFVMARNQKMPYTLNMSGFPSTSVRLYRDFPDIFDPAFQQAAERFARQLDAVKNDPYLIGYFLANEPQWGFGNNNLAFEMFAVGTPSFTKKEMSQWLQKKYGTIRAFNEAWKQNCTDFNAIEAITLRERPSETAWNDCWEFSAVMVDRYIETVCSEVKKVDPNHLNLGMRYASIQSELHYRAGEWFDVFSINGYRNPDPPQTAEIALRSGKPVMIGEWHFGSIDRGLPSSGLQTAENQTARGEAYRYYFEQGVIRPELIGIHWFQWNDQPVFGRYDGENCNIGFLDICNQPYPELTEQAKMSHEKMYRLATGAEQPFNKVIRRLPSIFH